MNMNGYQCPFCHFSRLADPSKGAEPFSYVRALRELAGHIVSTHPKEFRELAQTVSDEYNDPSFLGPKP